VHLNFTKLDLDEDGWNELHGMLTELMERALELQAAAVNKPAGERRHARLFVAKYEAP
jgi:hypothetical protein